THVNPIANTTNAVPAHACVARTVGGPITETACPSSSACRRNSAWDNVQPVKTAPSTVTDTAINGRPSTPRAQIDAPATPSTTTSVKTTNHGAAAAAVCRLAATSTNSAAAAAPATLSGRTPECSA